MPIWVPYFAMFAHSAGVSPFSSCQKLRSDLILFSFCRKLKSDLLIFSFSKNSNRTWFFFSFFPKTQIGPCYFLFLPKTQIGPGNFLFLPKTQIRPDSFFLALVVTRRCSQADDIGWRSNRWYSKVTQSSITKGLKELGHMRIGSSAGKSIVGY